MAAGAPNIHGGISQDCNSNNGNGLIWGYWGCFSAYSASGNTARYNPSGDRNNNHKHIDFYASRSSSVYGNSTTITPNSITTGFYIKYL